MKRPLEKHFLKDVRNGLRKTRWAFTALLIIVAFNLSYSQSISRAECECLNNATTSDNGQFGELIVINSQPGETWTVVTSEGLYQTSSPGPPLSPTIFPVGYIVPEVSAGVYHLNAIRITGTSWESSFTNGSSDLSVTSAHICNQPSNEVLGDFGSCIGSTETYSLDIPASQVQSVVWTLPAGGTIVSGQGTNEITVEWGDVVGSYDVSFEGAAYSYDGQFNSTCDIAGMGTVDIMDEEAFSMACNNQVNISLNGKCEIDFLADMVLEAMQFTNASFDLEFRDLETGALVVGPTLGMEYVGKLLEVKVIHECSGNSCWGHILMEDKTIPMLECGDDVTIDCDQSLTPELTGFPVGPDVNVVALGDGKYSLEGFDLCSDVTLSYTDVPLTSHCDGPFSSIIERTWYAIDDYGNSTTCVNLINVNKASLDDITFPGSYDDVLGPNSSLKACGNWPKLANGNPDPTFTGMPEGVFCLNVKVDYEDHILPICGENAFKVRRKWTVQDLCDASLPIVNHTQSITIMDNDVPNCNAPSPFTVGATDFTCSSIIEVPAPTVDNECSGWTYTVSYNLSSNDNPDPYFLPSNDGVVQQADGTYLISGLDDMAGDTVYILYYITDDCGNTSTCYTYVTIVDEIQPIPVCDLHTFVGLNEDGIGYADISSFDDGSWDNCGLEKLEVRRVANSGCGESSVWSDRVKFCCEDVGEIIMIQLRATDKSGNSNVCMVEAEVQDNHAPEFTFCPANITIDCDDDTVNLDQYGTATAKDNCTVSVTSTANRNINSCGVGTIIRTFKAEDNNQNSVTCIQKITVEALDPFYINPNNPNDPNDDIIWPGSHTITNGCVGTGIQPDALPAGKQRPVVAREGCSQISFTYDDVVFQYTDEACAKVIRTWKVIDDCVYQPFGNVGYWEYTQVIKVQNSTAPVFESGCSSQDFTIIPMPDCKARIQTTASATDDCTAVEDLEFIYKVDEFNNGVIDYTGVGATINREVPYGTHRILWEVEDECGNVRTCAALIKVDDNKAPTPYCLSEVVTVVMETSGEVTIWASDFDKGSYDNCADQEDLIASFSENTSNTNLTITCDDLTGVVTEIPIQMYITDPSGNSDFCEATLVIQDNQNYCGNDNSGDTTTLSTRIAIGGQIMNDENKTVEGVSISLEADLPEFPMVETTNDKGKYTFDNLLKNENYRVSPSLDENYTDGVSTLDLVLIQQHLLGLKPLNNPYKVIAADINNSQKVTASDLLQLRKLILGIYSELPSNKSWRFIDASHQFADINDPFPFNDQMTMTDMQNDYMVADFVAVKIGDVNNSAVNGLRGEEISTTRSATVLTMNDSYLSEGTHELTLLVDGIQDIYGFQFALDVNEHMVNIEGLSGSNVVLTEQNFMVADNKVTVSYHSGEAVQLDEQLLTIEIYVKKAGYVSEMIALRTTNFNNEIYSTAGQSIKTSPIALTFDNRNSAEANDFELLQNVPNPFSITTEIGFVLPTDQAVTLRVMDVTGKVVMSKQGNFRKGYNTITLDVSEIDASGILYYQLDTEGDSDTKKMIIIK